MQYCLHMVKRTYWIGLIEAAWRRRSVVWLSGVRRAGKTTLCRTLEDVEYLDCELPRVRLQDPEGFLETVRGKRIALDEVHRLDRPSELLKIAADHFPDVHVIATGSSTLGATAKFADTLTGRKVDVRLTPMIEQDRTDFGGSPVADRLWSGGLPSFFLGQAGDGDFSEWVDSYWARDIQEMFRLEKRSAFVRFVELLLVNSGGVFEATAYSAPCEVSRPTISTYLGVLETTSVATVVRPFSTRRATEIVSAPRVYGFDTGFVRHFRGLSDRRSEDLGQLWEHYVLNELSARLPDADIRYWRTKQHAEVDFVIVRRGLSPVAVECKWSSQNVGSLAGVRAFRTAYPDGENFVVSADVADGFTRMVSGQKVSFVGLPGLLRSLGG
jgi:predicted AAA+ superfamily ATPase